MRRIIVGGKNHKVRIFVLIGFIFLCTPSDVIIISLQLLALVIALNTVNIRLNLILYNYNIFVVTN